MILGGANSNDRQIALNERNAIRDIVAFAQEELSEKLKDWAYWDDTYSFVDDHNQEYITSNFAVESLENIALDAILLLDRHGKVAFSGLYDFEARTTTALPGEILDEILSNREILIPLTADTTQHGLLVLGDRIAFVASSSVLTSERKGPVNGAMIFVRFINGAVLERLGRLSRTHFQLGIENDGSRTPVSVEEAPMYHMSNDTIEVRDVLPTLRPQTNVMLSFQVKRTVFQQALSSLRSSLYLVLLTGVAFCLVILIFLERFVLSRLLRFHNALKIIKEEKNSALRVNIEGSDEIASLCTMTNEVLSALMAVEQEHTESEERFRHLADAAPVMIWMSGVDKQCSYFNRGWLNFTGRKLEDELGNGWANGVHPRDLVGCLATYTEAFDARIPFEMEYRLMRHDGEYRWIIDYGTPRHDGGGQFLGYIGSCYDITDRRIAESEMREARDVAEKASRSKSEFLANMSHEIRTPLNAIMGLTDLVLDSALDREQRENLSTVRTSCDSLLAIINDVLDFSKIEAGKLSLSEVNFSLETTIRSIVRLLSVSAERKGVHLRVEIGGEVPPMLHGDPDRLGQILINLVSNAIKFSNSGSEVLLAVLLSGVADDEVDVNFSVIDHGIGIPEERHAEIFRPFTQADGSITRQYGGTGLGLTISNRIARLMGGNLWVESEPGKGSTFHFNVVFKRIQESAHTASVALLPAEESADRGTASVTKLLVVEDNLINQKLIVKLLEVRGYGVKIASNGQEALSLASSGEFSLILMDCQMPVMDGYTATREIRELEKCSGLHIPIVAMTAHALDGDREKCLQAGMDDYIAKPIDRHRLYDLIEHYVKNPHS